MTKFCSDCQFCRPSDAEGLAAYKFAKCHRPPSEKPDGYTLTHPDNHAAADRPYCRVERMTAGLCDTEGKFFLAKTEA